MHKKIREKIQEIAEQNGDDITLLNDTYHWEYVLKHKDDFKEFFGELYSKGGWGEDYAIRVKSHCPVCEINKIAIKEFMDNPYQKYDNTMTITFNQDWLSSLWHIHKVEFGTYESFSGEES